jgi:hypothetical protein
MVCDLEDGSMLDAYFDGFMLLPGKSLGRQVEGDWTIKGTKSQGNGVHEPVSGNLGSVLKNQSMPL